MTNQATNLVILLSDQHSRHMLGCCGNPTIKTPNIDRLAAEGICFDNAYTNCPVCVPARAAMAIGDYGSRHGYWDNAHAYEGKCQSWGSRLTQAGLRVTTIGKLHFESDTPATGFPDQRIPLHIKDGVGDVYGEIRDRQITRPQFRKALEDACAGESDYTRYDREVARQAAEFLKAEGTAAHGPFALMVGFVAPHFPLMVPQEYVDLYPDPEKLPLPVQFASGDWPHHPALDDYRRYCCQEDLPDIVKRNAIRIYYALCSFLDAQIGTVLAALRAAGLEKSTRVIYCSDHGDTMGEHGLFFKSTMYEGSVGIPLILRGPGIAHGKHCATPVSLVDIYPTALECMGVPLSAYDRALPGTSLLRFAAGREEPERSVYAEYMSFGFYDGEFMLRKGRYKYICYTGERPQLFDLQADPNECVDRAGDPALARVQRDMDTELRRITDPEQTEQAACLAQKALLERFGGQEKFLRTFHPALFSPIPDLGQSGGQKKCKTV